MTDKLKDRAARCVTHFHACDCREYAYRERIEKLEDALQLIVDETPANEHTKWHHHHWYLVTAREALAQHGEPRQRECGWSLDDEGCYQTDCGTEFVSPDFLTLEEMPSMKYCANCGRRIRDDGRMGDG